MCIVILLESVKIYASGIQTAYIVAVKIWNYVKYMKLWNKVLKIKEAYLL